MFLKLISNSVILAFRQVIGYPEEDLCRRGYEGFYCSYKLLTSKPIFIFFPEHQVIKLLTESNQTKSTCLALVFNIH